MSGPQVIIITGAPGAGKTTVGRHIAQALGLPFISKDGIKETLFNSLGWKDRDWSRRLGAASMDVLFHLLELELEAGRSCVVESNFYPELAVPRFLALKQEYPYEPWQIVCRAEPGVLAQRYAGRVSSGERHPGHVDEFLLKEFDPVALQNRHTALDLGGAVFCVDTTDFQSIDFDRLIRTIRERGGSDNPDPSASHGDGGAVF